jgi:hypothetical protein
MNKEFLKIQKLAGLITEGQYQEKLNETQTPSPNECQRIIELYIDSHDAEYVAGFFDDTHKREVAAYLKSLKPYPKVRTVEELASTIKEIDDKINEITDYPEDLFDEEVIPTLEQIASNNPNLKNTVDEVLVVLNKLYGREDNNEDDEDDEFGWKTDYDEF